MKTETIHCKSVFRRNAEKNFRKGMLFTSG